MLRIFIASRQDYNFVVCSIIQVSRLLGEGSNFFNDVRIMTIAAALMIIDAGAIDIYDRKV
ncbi:MAG: hypothetical protein K5837_00990 [Candidatus Saccharibacteria bacterium]|nr:hypothetical protein [Candidatus Saccharibacteria bacterium]